MQKPHCRPWLSWNACCRRPRVPSGSARPSTVVTDAAVGLHGEHQAGADRLAVEQDVAVAAEAVLAGDVRAGQIEILAQEVRERPARLDEPLAPRAVDLDAHAERLSLMRAPLASVAGIAQSARRASMTATRRR